MTPKRVLLVVSDHGFHWDEVADAFHVFADAHWQVEVGSPLGHPRPDWRTLRKSRFLHLLGRGTTKSRAPENAWWGQPVAAVIKRTRRLDRVSLSTFDAVFVTGASRPAFELATAGGLARILLEARRNGLPIGGSAQVVFDEKTSYRHSRFAARAAWALVEAVVGDDEDLHGKWGVAEFLDRKSGRS